MKGTVTLRSLRAAEPELNLTTFGQGNISKLPCKMRQHCPHADNALYCSHSQHLDSRRLLRPVLVSATFQKLVGNYSAGQQHGSPLRISCSQFSSAQAGTPSSLAVRASVADTSIKKTEDLGLAVTPSDDSSTSAPILSGAGGGIFFWWQLGIPLYLALLES